ncbi:hypothetical protein JXA88_09175 [Candidatus Fermentibacteria bacterium]|nr:hypothetical protein [Candidatus Fermentibacteria bacterium]
MAFFRAHSLCLKASLTVPFHPSPALRERRSRFIELFRTTPPHTVCPNFYVLAHANGCAFSPQCSYCYLKSSFWYLPRSEAFTNVARVIDETRRWIARDGLETYVLNTGNLCDSLAFERDRPLMAMLIDTFREFAAGRPHTLLLVTKGGRTECRPLLESSACPNVVVSFSVTNPEAALRQEKGAASVNDRLAAAHALLAAGWRVRMRIDPMIAGYDHRGIADQVGSLPPERVTLGSLRAEPNLLRVMRDGLFVDLKPPEHPRGLARYPLEVRLNLYRPAVAALRAICPVALCEESEEVWRTLGLDVEARPCNCGE